MIRGSNQRYHSRHIVFAIQLSSVISWLSTPVSRFSTASKSSLATGGLISVFNSCNLDLSVSFVSNLGLPRFRMEGDIVHWDIDRSQSDGQQW